jgi:predicted Fe-S protein YdhL (DUF1289 family)
MSTEIKSPCIAVCRVKSGICIGCFRTAREITEWWDATSERKYQIVKDAAQRKIDFEAE